MHARFKDSSSRVYFGSFLNVFKTLFSRLGKTFKDLKLIVCLVIPFKQKQ